MEAHPIANAWPMMPQEKLEELAADIAKNGQRIPVWSYEEKILDGRNRYAACKIAGIEPIIEPYTGDQPAAFAVSMNDRRRHMTKSALAAVGVELLPFFEAEAKERQRESGGDRKSEKVKSVVKKVSEPIGRKPNPPARSKIAKSVGVNEVYIQDAKAIKESAPEIFAQLKEGKITMQDAKRLVKKKPDGKWRKDELTRKKMVQSGHTVVANAGNDKNLIDWAEGEGIAVRIDRGTDYGNPFLLDKDGDRDYVCDAFADAYLPHKKWIRRQIEMGKLTGKVLICHCYPQRCHGEALIELIIEGKTP